MTLRKKMVHGAFWSLVEKTGQQGLSFIVFMVLARLVGPEEYGLANLCFIYFTLTTIIVYGIVDGIVSLQVGDDIRLSSLFWTVMGVGLAICLVCLATAIPISHLMHRPRLAGLLYCFSVVPLLLALSAIPNMLVMKAMNFKVYALRTLVATLIGGAVGLVMAIKNFGAYAIVGQQLTLFVVMNLIVWPCAGWRPRFIFHLSSLREVIKPGINMLGLNAIGFIDQQVPRFLIGTILGPAALGYFAFVTRLRYAVQEMVINPPLSVLYPALAKIKHDKKEQQAITTKMVIFSGTFLYPLLAIASATAPLYVPLLFGKAWEPAILLLQIYMLGAAYSPLNMIRRDLFRTHNLLRHYLKIHVFVLLAGLVMLFLLLLPNGLIWMALGENARWFLISPVYIILLLRLLGINLWKDIERLWPSALGSAFSFAAIYGWRMSGFHPDNAWLHLLSALILGSSVYVLSCLLLQYRQTMEVVAFAKKVFKIAKEPAIPALVPDLEPEL